MKMNTYIVELELTNGCVEKDSICLVDARTAKQAGKTALLNEIHNQLGNGAEWEDKSYDRISDYDGEWTYTVYAVTLVDPADLKTIRKYIR